MDEASLSGAVGRKAGEFAALITHTVSRAAAQ